MPKKLDDAKVEPNTTPLLLAVIPDLRFTDGTYIYQMDEIKPGLFILRLVGAK